MGGRPSSVVERVLAGDVRTAARLMRDLDDRIPSAVEHLRALYPHTGRAALVGITGNPGAGKSTVVDALIAHHRAQGLRVGVVAIDPSSPFSGGALLGDRIRMQRHALDPGVFIRSLATRGQLGGLSRSTVDVVNVMDAMGFDMVLIETVGVGQDEIEVMTVADTVVVVMVPGLGDEVQALKAGLMEVADLFVVNKADREGVDRMVHDLELMLELRGPRPDRPEQDAPSVEIVRTVAISGQGIGDLAEAIGRHRRRAAERLAERRRRQAEVQIWGVLEDLFRAAAVKEMAQRGGLSTLAEAVAARQTDPYTAAQSLAAGLLR